MKRILVIDDSDAVRETIALLLEGDFAVAKKALGSQGLSLADVDRGVELLIIGVAPATVARASMMLNLAARGHFAILFLVDSKSIGKSINTQENVGWLAKPFNPYQLKAEVARLLAPPILRSPPPAPSSEALDHGFTRYLEFPYVDRVAASLIHRFAATRLPVLISGEMGCGQPRVARAMHRLAENPGSLCLLTGRTIAEDFLAERRSELAGCSQRGERSVTLLIDEIDKLPPSGQSLLLRFIEEEAEKLDGCRIFTTSNGDLLETVYRGEFLEPLYYRLATLKLTLAPVRKRREDIPAMARWFAQFYARELDLADVEFSFAANERLSRYLWFGNLSEIETVVARTLAVHKKTHIEEKDLIFDFDAEGSVFWQPELERAIQLETGEGEELKGPPDHTVTSLRPINGSGSEATHTDSVPDLRLLIHELAHELKNPMVTIKTFAQLLTDRYQDESFRARFQDVVDGDIERIDDILEVMVEFADFSQPRKVTIPLDEQVRAMLAEIGEESAQRQVRLGWKGNDNGATIVADEAQFKYVLKNTLLAVLLQAKMGSEIEIGIAKPGCLMVSYQREVARVASITQVLGGSTVGADESVPPLRILLAKQVLERNGGRIRTDRAESDRDMLQMEFPID
jgi:DNA-binding NtrC family response regulator